MRDQLAPTTAESSATNDLSLGHKIAILTAVSVVIFSALAVGRSMTALPHQDEAYYALPAWNLATHGSFGSPVIETSASPIAGVPYLSMQGIKKHTYWVMVLPILLRAGWFESFGYSLLKDRLFTVFWAFLTLLAAYFLSRSLTGRTTTACLTVAILASDVNFVKQAGFGRDDMMSEALGFWGLQAYLALRQRSLPLALLAANALIAAAGMSHPNGGILSATALLLVGLHLDRDKFRWRHLFATALPYLVGGALVSIYVLLAPADCKAQFAGNATGRFTGILAPLSLLPNELNRYLQGYGFDTPGWISKTKVIILALYAVSIAFVCRRAERRAKYRSLLLISAAYFGVLTLFENYKFTNYLVYPAMLFAIFAAVALGEMASSRPRTFWAVLVGMLLFEVGVSARSESFNKYAHDYMPAIDYMKTHPVNGVVMGPVELGFGYGFDSNLIDDIRLGFNSHKQPAMIVANERFLRSLHSWKTYDPVISRYVENYLQNRCGAGGEHGEYTVYLCNPDLGR